MAGARQFFTRAYDFGYSKTLDEALRLWPRDSVLKDVLDVVRRFRPQIIVSVFSGTPRDGHGQHQVAGLVARQAFEALRDSSWGPVKLYRSLYSDTASATLRLDAGLLDPVEGRSYHQIAMAGRSQHRSQDQGQLEEPGPRIDRLAFIEWRDRGGGRGTNDGDGLFAGVDTLFPGKARYAGLVDSARERLDAMSSPVPRGTLATRRFAVTVAADAPRSQAYFLRRPLVGALYDWSGVPTAWRGVPFEPPPVQMTVRLTIAGQPLTLSREVVYRYRDQGTGEVRRPLFVTRSFDVAVTPDLVVWPVDGTAGGLRHFTITVTNRTRGPAVARIALATPPGWSTLRPDSLSFEREDEAKSLSITLAPPASVRPGEYELKAAALGAGRDRSDGALALIDYPHIRPRAVVHASTAELRAARIALPAVTRVGYVRGASDRVPEALQAVGVPIELLGADTLARGDLSRYDAIVIGSRAYETEPALVASNGRLLDYVRAGGLVIVQYQQYPFVNGGFAPYRLSIARPHDRVTDETAAATELDSASRVFHVPNDIGPDDWRGWVQERGLYFAHDWDPAYTPLVELHDPGEPPLQGGLLVATVGKGTYVYTGLSFFRQLPAGVPGAYRLFANLLALGKR